MLDILYNVVELMYKRCELIHTLMEQTTFEKGQKVTTKHGEELTILDVQFLPLKKQGKPTGTMMEYFLAESGGHNTWFPITILKEEE